MRFLLTSTLLLIIAHTAAAQPPRPPGRGGGAGGGGGFDRGAAPTAEEFLARLMSLDANQDGRLTRDEVADVRLHPLLDRADANKDGSVTADELKELHARESAALGSGRGSGPMTGGPGGPGGGPRNARDGEMGQGGPGPGGPGPGGPGGQGGAGGMPRPGEVLPARLQDDLRLTDRQREQVAALQKDVDARLQKILTAEQRTELSRMRERGPGGPGRPGGRGDNGRPMPGAEGERQERRPSSE